MKIFIFLLSLLLSVPVFSQDALFTESPAELKTPVGLTRGTILGPQPGAGSVPVVLLIAGSGSTDRNGNNSILKNNHLKMLAEALAKQGIASLRYDKRGIAQSPGVIPSEADLRFEDLIEDATGWIRYLKNEKKFSRIVVVGHSEGSLVGMVAARQAKPDGFVSVAGAGQSIDKILKQQLQNLPLALQNEAYQIIDSLTKGKMIENVNPTLVTIFRPSVQPYLISWFKYDPLQEIKKLTVPVLIVQGTTDLQVTSEDAKRLANAKEGSRLVMIDEMNHILKRSPADRQANVATYSNPDLPVVPKCVEEIAKFIVGLPAKSK